MRNKLFIKALESNHKADTVESANDTVLRENKDGEELPSSGGRRCQNMWDSRNAPRKRLEEAPRSLSKAGPLGCRE